MSLPIFARKALGLLLVLAALIVVASIVAALAAHGAHPLAAGDMYHHG